MSKKMAIVPTDVPYKTTGGIMHQQPVFFDVYRVDGHCSLRLCQNIADRTGANLPGDCHFFIENGKLVYLREYRRQLP